MTAATARHTWLPVAAVMAGVAVVDWTTKIIASSVLDDRSFDVASVLTLRLSHNSGIAFGLGDRLPVLVVIALTGIATAALAVAVVRGLFPSRVAAGLVLGGAVANVVDRVVGGDVVDFLDLGWWPSFNLADAALSVGCVALGVASLRAEARHAERSA